MLLEALAAREGRDQALHDILLLRRELIRILRIDRREIRILHRIALPVNDDLAALKIHLGEAVAVLHGKLRPPVDQLPLQLELDDGDGLVDPHVQFIFLTPQHFSLGFKAEAGIVPVGLRRELGQRQDIDAVAVLEDAEIPVAHAEAHHAGDERRLARSRSHPLDVVVAPLHVHAVVIHERIHDIVRPVAAVIDIPQDMQVVDDQPADQLRDRLDKGCGPPDPDDRAHDLIVVGFLVLDVRLLRDQLLDHIGEILRHRLADLGPRIFGGRVFADLHQPVEHDLVPVIHLLRVRDLLLNERDLLRGVVDQRRELPDVLLRQRPAEDLVDLLSDGARPVAEHMGKRLIFPVDIRYEVLRALRQVHDRA